MKNKGVRQFGLIPFPWCAGHGAWRVSAIWLTGGASHGDRVNGKEGMLCLLPVALPGNWTQFVDEPMTDSEMEKLRRSVHRQAATAKKSGRWRLFLSG